MSINYTVTLSEAQDKALSTVAISQQEWIENMVYERCRLAIDEIVNAEVKRKLDAGEPISGSKEEIVLAADVETAFERNEKALADIQSRMNG